MSAATLNALRTAFVTAVVLGQLGVGLVDVAAGRWRSGVVALLSALINLILFG